jgi:hypothetical protein
MSIKLEGSLCGQCIHFKKVNIPEMRNTFALRCNSLEKYIKTPKKSCNYYEPMTWESFLDASGGGKDED